MRSIFVEDAPVKQVEDGLTTRAEVEALVKESNMFALGGGCVKVDFDPLMTAKGDDKPYQVYFANGQVVNAGVLKEAIRNAVLNNKIEGLKAEYSKPSETPCGIAWFCSEQSYHAVRQAAADGGLPVMGGGYLAETGVEQETLDTEAIGQIDFPVPPQGTAKRNFVIVFQPLESGKEAPVANAAFLGHMILAAGIRGAKAFVKSRSMPKGWRASPASDPFVNL